MMVVIVMVVIIMIAMLMMAMFITDMPTMVMSDIGTVQPIAFVRSKVVFAKPGHLSRIQSESLSTL